MPEWLRVKVLELLRVPPEPEPPPGDPSSLRVFRAAPAFFRYRLVAWGLGQLGALVGLLVGSFLLGGLVFQFSERWLGSLAAFGGVLAWAAFLVQLPLSLAALHLDWELRWYMLSDRALRIRDGIFSVREKTVTFANIQQIAIRQGPVQQLLGLADIEVRSAGGGSPSGKGGESDLHRGYLRGVADGEAIRDTMRARVERYRDGGPRGVAAEAVGGEPGEGRAGAVAAAPGSGRAVVAAGELLDEVRGLRRAVSPRLE